MIKECTNTQEDLMPTSLLSPNRYHPAQMESILSQNMPQSSHQQTSLDRVIDQSLTESSIFSTTTSISKNI